MGLISSVSKGILGVLVPGNNLGLWFKAKHLMLS